MLSEIIRELERPPGERTSIPGSEVQRWMKSQDADTLGATYGFLSKAEQVHRVTPPLSFDDVVEFMLHYYGFCLRTDPRSPWANSRYSAGWDLVGWFTRMWNEKREKKYFQAIKSLLEKLYVTGDPELKKCIEHAVVEHLFERKDIRTFFSDWLDNSELRPLYDEGNMWIDGDGKSPLTERGH